MKWAALLVLIAETLAFPALEPTTIQIQNYDGPIFLHIPAQNDETCSQNYPTYQQTEIECTCIAKPSIKYIPINTASESSCYNRNDCRTYAGNNGGICTCGTCYNGKHCGTCTCENSNSDSNGRTCTCGNCDNGKHCRTRTYATNNSGNCSCGASNDGRCTCGSSGSGSCTCTTDNGRTCGLCDSYNEGIYNKRGYKGTDKECYTLDIVKPRSYDSGYNNCICHKCPCY